MVPLGSRRRPAVAGSGKGPRHIGVITHRPVTCITDPTHLDPAFAVSITISKSLPVDYRSVAVVAQSRLLRSPFACGPDRFVICRIAQNMNAKKTIRSGGRSSTPGSHCRGTPGDIERGDQRDCPYLRDSASRRPQGCSGSLSPMRHPDSQGRCPGRRPIGTGKPGLTLSYNCPPPHPRLLAFARGRVRSSPGKDPASPATGQDSRATSPGVRDESPR